MPEGGKRAGSCQQMGPHGAECESQRKAKTMVIRVALGFLGLFHLANGLYMLAAPDAWYAAVPGVTLTGPINHHFIEDVGLAYIASALGLLLGARKGNAAAAFALAGATWPVLHALLHLWGWTARGIPHDANIFLSEAVGVIGLAALTATFAGLRARQEGML